MTMNKVWRGLKTSVLAAAVLCAGNLVLTTGCAENCDTCGRQQEKKACDKCPADKKACGKACDKPCDKPCDKK